MPMDMSVFGNNDEQVDEHEDAGGDGVQRERLTAAALQQATRKQVEAQVLAQFMKDPSFAKLSEARINQKKVHILTDDELEALRGGARDAGNNPSSGEEEVDLESMDKKQLVGYMLKQLTKQVEPMFKQRMQPAEEKISQLSGFADEVAKERAIQEISSAQQRFPDFETYREDMIGLRERAPGLNVTQLYLLAKAEKGGFVPKSSRAGSERPSSFTGKPVKKRDHTTDALRALMRNKATELAEGLDDSMDFGE